jgi:signal peptidase I
MYPEFKEGDFVLITRFPFVIKNLTIDDVIVFNHDNYGLLIKKIAKILPDGELFIKGTQITSLDSRQLGSIPISMVRGKVIWHIRKPQ